MGESYPPRFPKVFMSPESDPVNSSVRSIQAAQNVLAANMLNPAPSASMRIAAPLLETWLPDQRKIPEVNIPSQTAVLRPCLLPQRRTAISENQPPTGASAAIPIYGMAPPIPAWEIVRCLSRTR